MIICKILGKQSSNHRCPNTLVYEGLLTSVKMCVCQRISSLISSGESRTRVRIQPIAEVECQYIRMNKQGFLSKIPYFLSNISVHAVFNVDVSMVTGVQQVNILQRSLRHHSLLPEKAPI